MYKLVITDDEGNIQRFLQEWQNGRFEQRLNEPGLLQFHVPYDKDISSDLSIPNEVRLLDDDGDLIERYIFRHVEETGPIPRQWRVECSSLLSRLSREWITSYNVTDSNVSDILGDLLDFQVIDNPITLGTVHDDIGNLERDFEVRNISILGAIRQLHLDVLGFYKVNIDGELEWDVSSGEDVGQQIRLGKNLQNIVRRKDYSKLANRIYVYGLGFGGDQIKLTDAKEPEEYIEDVTSVATYGIQSRAIVNQRVSDPDTLKRYAQNILDITKEPVISYTTGAVDLSKSAGGLDFEKFILGNTVRIIDEVFDIDIALKLIRISTDMDNPLRTEMEFATQRSDFRDTLVETFEHVRALQHTDPLSTAFESPERINDLQSKLEAARIIVVEKIVWDAEDVPDEPDEGDKFLSKIEGIGVFDKDQIYEWDSYEEEWIEIEQTQFDFLGEEEHDTSWQFNGDEWLRLVQTYIADTKDDLPSVEEPAWGWAGGRYFVRRGDKWIGVSDVWIEFSEPHDENVVFYYDPDLDTTFPLSHVEEELPE